MEKYERDNLTLAADQLWQFLFPQLSYLSQEDQEFVHLAFMQMVEAHGEQRRKSGDYYIIHPVEACAKLCTIGLDRDTLAACLLHDVPEDTDTPLSEIQKNFGDAVAFLVYGITKLGTIKYQGDQRYAENLRRMFVAMSKDLRVIFIKLADRMHNLQTLEHVNPEKQRRIALESLDIYAKLAGRLGIGKFKSEIEDLVFPYLYPESYQHFISLSDLEIEKRKLQLAAIQSSVESVLHNEGITPLVIQGRAKRYYSIFQKIHDKKKLLKDIYDLVALRIIVHSVEECYEVLSVVHRSFEPIPGRFKDYIQQPKPNGYRSLHTGVRDRKSGVVFEFQIRTQEMHDFAEFGVAAHWAYKEKHNQDSNFLDAKYMKWITELVDLGNQEISDEEYLKRVKLDLFEDRIFVLTPNGDVIDLPHGSTPLDFAFRVHEDIGLHASMAKVNGAPVKLTQPLQSGDKVEILTDKKQHPKLDWLNSVATVAAARKIRNSLRKQGYSV